MLQPGDAGLLAEAGLEEMREEMRNDEFAAVARGRGGSSRVETVEDEEVAFRVVHGRKFGDALQAVQRREGVHLVVFDMVPGDVPAGAVGTDADGEVHRAEVVADRRQAGHEREIGPTDGEDQ